MSTLDSVLNTLVTRTAHILGTSNIDKLKSPSRYCYVKIREFPIGLFFLKECERVNIVDQSATRVRGRLWKPF